MSQLESLGPTQRAAVLAAYRAPNRTLRRSLGGWWLGTGADGKPVSFTIRTVNMLARAYIVDLRDPFDDAAPMTAHGEAIALQLLADTDPRAAA